MSYFLSSVRALFSTAVHARSLPFSEGDKGSRHRPSSNKLLGPREMPQIVQALFLQVVHSLRLSYAGFWFWQPSVEQRSRSAFPSLAAQAFGFFLLPVNVNVVTSLELSAGAQRH
eukprot:jgi/Chlat1/6958/Chrsp52S06646